MKRYIAILLSVLLMVQACGCSTARDLFPENTESQQDGQTTAIDEEGLKVGFLFPSNNDATDTTSHVEGIRKMQVETGLCDTQIIIKKNVTKENCSAGIDELVEKGCNIIFACDKTFETEVVDAASRYPEVQFCQEDGKKAKKSELDNMHNFYVRLYEAYYAAGVAAGMKLNDMLNRGKISSSNCVIGFVANEESPENISCLNAFYLGVGQVCSQASMMVRYVDSKGVYDDDGEAAKQLVEAGVGMMCTHVYTTAVAAVCAENDIPVVGNEVNIINAAPKEAITSAVADWSVYYTYAVDCVLNGEAIDVDWCGGYDDGAVILTQLNDAILVDGTVEKLQEIEKNLRNGKEKVFDTEKMTIDGDNLEELVGTDKDYKKYKNLVSNGEFKESSKRSAPTMEFLVDGVEVSTYDYLEEDEEESSESTTETDDEE